MSFVISDGEGHAQPTELSASEFLASYPRGAYTTARTVGGNAVFELTFHIQRLVDSARLMLEDNAKSHGAKLILDDEYPTDDVRAYLDLLRMGEWVKCTLRAGIRRFCELQPSEQPPSQRDAGGADDGRGARPYVVPPEGEYKLTMLLCWGDGSRDTGGQAQLYAHIGPITPTPKPPVKVHAYGKPRANPHAKDSQWVKDRAELERRKPADVNEVLLVGDDGSVLEGMSSNVFVVDNGNVVTADEGILHGTVRKMVLETCAELSIPVKLEAPNVSRAREWQSAFLSSTSRLVLPIDELTVVGSNGATHDTIRFTDHSVTHRIRAQVSKDIVDCSESIL